MLPVYLDITDKAKNIINKNIWYMFDLLKATCEGLSYEEVLDGIFPQYILAEHSGLRPRSTKWLYFRLFA